MNQYTILAIAFGVFVGFFTTASSMPMVFCSPTAMAEMPLKAKQMCFALFDPVEVAPPQEEAEPADNQIYARGAKRQDVDHVFLRFGRRYGL